MALSILQIHTSPLGDYSASRKLSAKILAEIHATHSGSSTVVRDLVEQALPHLDGLTVGAFFTPADQRNAAQDASLSLSDELIDEVIAADVIIIGAPMWNFGIPSALKAWIDHIARVGRTFKYGASGPESLLPAGKKVIIASSRGGVYSSGPMLAMDHQETYLTAILGFLGLHDVSFVRAEGLAMGEEAVSATMKSADAQTVAAVQRLA